MVVHAAEFTYSEEEPDTAAYRNTLSLQELYFRDQRMYKALQRRLMSNKGVIGPKVPNGNADKLKAFNAQCGGWAARLRALQDG